MPSCGRAALLALVLGCATTQQPPADSPAEPAHPSGVVVSQYDPNAEDTVTIAVEHTVRRDEREATPPPRHAHQHVITAAEFKELVDRYPYGFKPAVCQRLCQSDRAISPEGAWTWVLRCKLAHGVRGESVVACREDPVKPEDAERLSNEP